MKVNVESIPVESGGVTLEGEFRIRNSAKAFNILSSGLYKNKIAAILRELGCNAYDSHVEAGKKDVPFTVHLPTTLNPQFYVRDYGIGLDHKGVTELYTTYFESTKQDSNDFVGCLGLGSKSPFSYTTTFNVTAIKDGKKRVYNAYINERGVPSIAKLLEEDTDEGNGLEVGFTVKDRAHISSFAQEARTVYQWFKTKPEIIGNNIGDIPKPSITKENIVPGVHMLGDYRRNATALMGNVAYPINIPSSFELDKSLEEVATSPLLVEFDIGELDVAASREELSYIPHTVDSLKKRFREILDNLTPYVEKVISAEKTPAARAAKANELPTKSSLFREPVLRYVKKNRKLFPEQLTMTSWGHVRILASEEPTGLPVTMKEVSLIEGRVSRKKAMDSWTVNSLNNSTGVLPLNKKLDTKQNWHLLCPENFVLVCHDMTDSVYNRMREDNNRGISGSVLRNKDIMVCRIRGKVKDKKKVFEKVREYFGYPETVYSSELPAPPSTKNKKDGLVLFGVDRVRVSYGRIEYKLESVPSDYSSLRKAPNLKKPVYVPLINKSIVDADGRGHSAEEFFSRLNSSGLLKFLEIDDTHIYGIRKTSMGDINKKKWINLYDLIEERVNDINWDDVKKELTYRAIREEKSGKPLWNIPDTVLEEFVSEEGDFSDFCRTVREIMAIKGSDNLDRNKLHNLFEAVDTANRFFLKNKVDLSKHKEGVQEICNIMRAAEQMIEEVYPMLSYCVREGSGERFWKDVMDYIKTVDSASH